MNQNVPTPDVKHRVFMREFLGLICETAKTATNEAGTRYLER